MGTGSALLLQHRQKLAQVRQLQAEIASIESNADFKREQDFESKVKALADEYGYSAQHILSIFGVLGSNAVPAAVGTKQARKVVTYRNPQTNEQVEYRGGNHPILAAWRAQYGSSAVSGWVV